RGFAAMSQEKSRAIQSLGGKAGHVQGKAHTWTREEARIAGRKGGLKRKSSGIPNLKTGQPKSDVFGSVQMLYSPARPKIFWSVNRKQYHGCGGFGKCFLSGSKK
ncbi:MAG TPA: hypothetical protein VEP90_24350, partial [Methylomirabilota bacterium]|nr:hypothetical protein [Methylomirabilota bacterium]